MIFARKILASAPSLVNLNRFKLIAHWQVQVVSSITASYSVCFDGSLDVDLNEPLTNLVL